MTTINLQGVGLRTHEEPYVFDYSPYAHQHNLLQMFREKSSFVAVNDSPTGGGKTCSWLAPALNQRLNTVAVYPTNALIEDQSIGIEERIEEVGHDVGVLKLTSSTLAEKRAEYGFQSNAEVITNWMREARRSSEQVLFLTNPDIFVMMCRDLYAKPARPLKRFELAVVDEFHRAGLKEQNTLRYLLDEVLERNNTRLKYVVLLSATPDRDQETLFERAMSVPYHRVTQDQQDEKQPFNRSLEGGWKPVMPPVELEIDTAPTFGTADILVDEQESVLEFCRGGRTVLMLDGIHEVGRVFSWLDKELDCCVERIDGFYSENKREKLESFDVLVSNSAVEVGIDFDVERIIFAGHNKASFLQRLGRLRSEDQERTARCYVPKTIKREFDDLDGVTLSREELREELDKMYPEPREPETFDRRFSASEAKEHLSHRLRNAAPDQQEDIKKEGIERIQRHFLSHYDLTPEDLERTIGTIDWQVLRDLQWYRGDSVQALIWDTIEETLRTYDLFYLLRYGDIEFYKREAFEQVVDDEYLDEVSQKARYVDGFCTYHGNIETTEDGYGRDVAFTGGILGGWIENTEDTGRKPSVKDGLKLAVESGDLKPVRNASVDDPLNQRLKNRSGRMGDMDKDDGGILCFPVSGTTKAVKNTYDLGDFFFLYPVWLTSGDPYSLAIGTDALYLYCHVQERKEEDFLIDI